MDRCAVLDAAGEAVGEGPDGRGRAYGPVDAGLGRIAALWSADLGIALDAADVARLMALLKLARVAVRPGHADSWIDVAGYAALGAELAGARRQAAAPAAADADRLELAAELEAAGAPAPEAVLEELLRACAAPPADLGYRIAALGPELEEGECRRDLGPAAALTEVEVRQVHMLRRRHWAAPEIALWLEVDQALVEAAIAAAPDCEPVPGLAVIMDDEAADPVAECADAVAETVDPVGEIADPVADTDCQPEPEPELAPEPDPEPKPEPEPDTGNPVSAADARGREGWSPREDLALLEAFGAGKRAAEVAKVVGRGQAAVVKRFRQLVPEPQGLMRQRKALDLARQQVAKLDGALDAAAGGVAAVEG